MSCFARYNNYCTYATYLMYRYFRDFGLGWGIREGFISQFLWYFHWTLHSLWCLLKVKHRVTCKNGAWKFRNMCDSLVIRVEADTNSKVQDFFSHFVIKCMISHSTMPSIWQTHTIHFLHKKIQYPLPFEWSKSVLTHSEYEKMLGGGGTYYFGWVYIRILGCPKSAIGSPKDTWTPLWLKACFSQAFSPSSYLSEILIPSSSHEFVAMFNGVKDACWFVNCKSFYCRF